MSMGFKPCPHCDRGEAEALYAIDGKVEWYCPECQASWTEDPVVKQESQWQLRMLNYYGEY